MLSCCRHLAVIDVLMSFCSCLSAVTSLLARFCCFVYAVVSNRRWQALPYVMNDAWRLTFINNANACLLFLPVLFFFEGAMLWEVRAFLT